MATSGRSLPSIEQLLKQFNLPGLDINSLIESQKKDIEALTAANQRAYEGVQSLAQRQIELLQEAMQKWQASTHGANVGQAIASGAPKQVEAAKQAFEQAFANMRELTEMAAKSQTEAYSIIQKRMQERMEEIARPLQGKQTPAPAKK